MIRILTSRAGARLAPVAAVLVCCLLGLVLAAEAGAAGKKEDPRLAALAAKYQTWLYEVELIISEEEVEAFLSLEKDYQRDSFIEKFWRIRDPYPDTTRNEYRDRWYSMMEEANALFGGLEEDRAKMLLLNGLPDARIEFRCSGVTYPLEVWFFDGSDKTPFEFFLVFVQRFGGRRWVLWYPGDGLSDIVDNFSAGSRRGNLSQGMQNCENGRQVLAILQKLMREAIEFELLMSKILHSPNGPSPEWVATFESYSTDLPEGASVFAATLDLEFTQRYQSRTIMEGTIQVDLKEAGITELAGTETLHFLVAGEILSGTRLFENFRYKFDFPASAVAGGVVPMTFQRRLRPGSYKLIIRVEDLSSKKFYREERDIEVPFLDGHVPVIPKDSESARILEAATAALTLGETTMKIIRPRGEMLSGMVRFDTLTTGDQIAEIEFKLNESATLRKRNPPFSVEFDLGAVPRTHTLVAVARNLDKEEVARDELVLNAGTHRFAVRLAEPRSGVTYTDTIKAAAEVTVPKDSVVHRVEFYLNEDLLATLYQPPFVQSIELPESGALAYVRAVAYRPDGSSTEDLVFINAPDFLEEVDVEFVEVYTTVLDKRKRPVLDLGVEAFSAFEDQVPQKIVRFDLVRDLPIHAGIMLDVSASMESSINQARDAALEFFESAITSKDRAALISFNDHPQLLVKFTNDRSEMAAGLAGLKAERGTALYDSLIFSLYYFNGIMGQRVLLLLSDGKDENSRFSFEDALEYAHRTGVAIYAIGLNIEGKGTGPARKALSRISEETGGRAFFIKDAAELASIYSGIQEELRSRYLIGYQSSNATGSKRFREVEIRVDGKGLEVMAMRGYYP